MVVTSSLHRDSSRRNAHVDRCATRRERQRRRSVRPLDHNRAECLSRDVEPVRLTYTVCRPATGNPRRTTKRISHAVVEIPVLGMPPSAMVVLPPVLRGADWGVATDDHVPAISGALRAAEGND